MNWIKPKDKLPPEKVLVMARNPHIEAISWIDGKDELGKASWCHEKWEHADGFVSEWRCLTHEEIAELIKKFKDSKMERYGCSIGCFPDLISLSKGIIGICSTEMIYNPKNI